ncbi:helix-turn-helix domain-containing protein [Sphingomonas morindae]|uniref:Helix-turn-helix transcriptional regulator n=1 Tax=Sphingomonas morindae TaxID=1541170 RepID=A0ABY4X731_9SPHN|nr:helix-turn-helix transcriptional regulator [Sphingomonas morindae]USI72733.1 helix-turn-helix transcriptional regulator [Sphingomonas morindae]
MMRPEEMKALRKAAGLTQAEFASALGMHRVTISDMERGVAPIETRTALAARYLSDHPERVRVAAE